MRDEAKADDVMDQLRDAFAQNLRTAVSGLPAHQALQVADALCAVQMDVLAGLRVAYKSKPVIDSDAIAEDWRKGLSVGEITSKHKCGKVTAYKHHPGKKKGRAASA